MNDLILLQAASGSNPFDPIQLVLLGGILVVFYFFMIRPQQKKASQQKKFIDALKKGDKVISNGGICGKIIKVSEETVLLEIDANTKMKVLKSAISAEATQNIYKQQSSKEKEE